MYCIYGKSIFTIVRYTEHVRYWEGPLSEVPLYTHSVIEEERRRKVKKAREVQSHPEKVKGNGTQRERNEASLCTLQSVHQ